MGLTAADFAALTPAEFRSVAEAWRSRREAEGQAAWERMRLLATITVQPHIKRRLTPQQLLPLPWEKPKDARPHPPSTKERVQEMMRKRK